MPNEVEPWLWKKAVAAVRRYYRWPAMTVKEESNPTTQAFRTMEENSYRTGWIMGYRAGRRSARSGEANAGS